MSLIRMRLMSDSLEIKEADLKNIEKELKLDIVVQGETFTLALD